MQNGTLPFMQKGTLTNPISNVRRCWLAMPLGDGVLRWVLACHTIEKKRKSNLHPLHTRPAYKPLRNSSCKQVVIYHTFRQITQSFMDSLKIG